MRFPVARNTHYGFCRKNMLTDANVIRTVERATVCMLPAADLAKRSEIRAGTRHGSWNASKPTLPKVPFSVVIMLDHSSYPHIIDLVFTYAPHAALLALRGASTEFCARADAVLAEHVAVRTNPSNPGGLLTITSVVTGGRIPRLMHYHNGDCDTLSMFQLSPPLALRVPSLDPTPSQVTIVNRLSTALEGTAVVDHVGVDLFPAPPLSGLGLRDTLDAVRYATSRNVKALRYPSSTTVFFDDELYDTRRSGAFNVSDSVTMGKVVFNIPFDDNGDIVFQKSFMVPDINTVSELVVIFTHDKRYTYSPTGDSPSRTTIPGYRSLFPATEIFTHLAMKVLQSSAAMPTTVVGADLLRGHTHAYSGGGNHSHAPVVHPDDPEAAIRYHAVETSKAGREFPTRNHPLAEVAGWEDARIEEAAQSVRFVTREAYRKIVGGKQFELETVGPV